MSHFTKMKLKILDKELLLRCLQEMGYKVQERATISGYKESRSVDIAVRMNEGYDLGFVKATDGTYELLADWWGVRKTTQGEFSRNIQAGLQKIEEMQRQIRREYALKTALAQLQAQSFQVVERRTETDGTVKFLARRWR